MDTTANLDLPYIMPSQAQKHVTHNEALELLDAIVQLAVLDRDRSVPPGEPGEAARYIVATDAEGAWEGQDGRIALWRDGGWRFLSPREGWTAWVIGEAVAVRWTGSDWQNMADAATLLQNLSLLGVGTTADAGNPFAAKLNNALWTARATGEGGDGDLRYTMNKQATANVLSLLMQSNWSGRAEIGLVGDDDLSIKVSANGTSWKEALKVDRGSGQVAFPQTRVMTNFAVNLFPDSGRFGGNAVKGTSVGSFVFPSNLSLLNGTMAADGGKFIHDNTDYGGAAGTLPPMVKDLVDMIRSPSHRRYGVEFRVALVTMGTGTQVPATVRGNTYYQSTFIANAPRLAAQTFHVYLRALDAPIVWLWQGNGQTFIRNGERLQAHQIIAPEEGWVSITMQDAIPPYASTGYSPSSFLIFASATEQRYLIACPALIPGITEVDDNVGAIAAINRWLP